MKKSSRIQPISEKLMKQLTVCMDARFECYTYRAPKMGVSEMPAKCNKYLKEYSEFKKMYNEEFKEEDPKDAENRDDGQKAAPVNPFAKILSIGK